MTEHPEISEQCALGLALMRDRLGIGGRDLATALGKARGRLPLRIYKAGKVLARAEWQAAHPTLRLTLNEAELTRSASAFVSFLEAIDPADRRKGMLLGALGALSFNLLVLFAILVAVLVWRGFL